MSPPSGFEPRTNESVASPVTLHDLPLRLSKQTLSSVGIETRYGLYGSGIESRWGREFPHLFRPALELIQPPAQWVSGLFPGGKAAGARR